MKTHTNSYMGDIKLFSDRLLKSWLAVAILLIGIKEIKIACIVLVILAARAAIEGLNPIYLGLIRKQVHESRIVKFGLPMGLVLAAVLLAQTALF